MNDRLRHLVRRAFTPGVKRIATADAVAYLQDIVAPRLGIPPAGEFTRIRAGANTAVIRWTTVPGDVLYARVWPWKRRHSPVRQHRNAAALLNAAGLRTPELLFEEDSTPTVTQWGVEAIVEREAPGHPLPRLADERGPAFTGLVRDLVRLHAAEGAAWNRPWLHRQGLASPSSLWEERLSRFRERITPRTSSLTAMEISRSLELLRRGLGVAASRRPVLVHGDVSRNHIFIDQNDDFTWIDLETVHYGAAEEDLASVSHWLHGRLLVKFLRAYAEAAGRPIDLAALQTFCMLMHWERLNSRVQQTRRRGPRQDEGRKNLDKLARDRLSSEAAIRGLLARGDASFADPDAADAHRFD